MNKCTVTTESCWNNFIHMILHFSLILERCIKTYWSHWCWDVDIQFTHVCQRINWRTSIKYDVAQCNNTITMGSRKCNIINCGHELLSLWSWNITLWPQLLLHDCTLLKTKRYATSMASQTYVLWGLFAPVLWLLCLDLSVLEFILSSATPLYSPYIVSLVRDFG